MSVTMLDTSSWTAAERQAAARDAYRASGYRLSGAELGRRFGRSGRWGRAQIEAVATEDRAAATGKRDRDDVSPVAATDGGTARGGVAAGCRQQGGRPRCTVSGCHRQRRRCQFSAGGCRWRFHRGLVDRSGGRRGYDRFRHTSYGSQPERAGPPEGRHRGRRAPSALSLTCQLRCAGHRQAP